MGAVDMLHLDPDDFPKGFDFCILCEPGYTPEPF